MLFLSLTCFCGFVQAQNLGGPPPFPGNNAPLPGGPAGAVQNPAPATGAGGDAADVRLQFPQTDIGFILKFYEQLTGKQMVADNSAAGPVSIDISKLVTREEAIRIIETSLYLNGYELIPGEGNIVKVVGPGKNPRQFGVNIYSDISQIPDNVTIASVLFELNFTDSKDMKAIVDQYVAGSASYASVALPGSLIVTENTVMLRDIARIIAAADVAPAEVQSRFFKLQRANAKDVLDQMTKLFDKSAQSGAQQGSGPNTGPLARFVAPNGQPLPPGSMQIPASLSGLSEDSLIVGKIKLDADERTNRIHVVTRPVNMPFIENLIAEYDYDIQFGEPVKRPLKYVDAADILDVLVKAITEPGAKSDEETGGTTNPQPTNNVQPNTSGGLNNGSGNNGEDNGGGLSISPGLEEPQRDITPKAVTVGNTKIIADPRENTIIVLGNDEVKQKIFTLLDQLDVRAPQVMLNTVIGEYTLNNDSNFGVDYLLHYPSGPLASLLSGSSSSGLGSTGFLNGNSGAAVTQFTGAPIASTLGSAIGAGTGFTAAVGAANSLDVIVNALESTGRFHITNQPMVCASNNKKAMIVSGEEIAIPTSTLSNLTSASGVIGSTAAVQSSVEYKQVALQLEVVPLINSDREVSLDILQKLDSPSGATQNVGGSLIPTITTRYLRTNISVPNKSTIVLGGLITKTVGGSSSQLPLLGRIPLLGYLFGNKTKQSDRQELIILIRPVVMNSPNEMENESHFERNKLLMEPDVDSTISPHDSTQPKGVNFRYQENPDAKQVQ